MKGSNGDHWRSFDARVAAIRHEEHRRRKRTPVSAANIKYLVERTRGEERQGKQSVVRESLLEYLDRFDERGEAVAYLQQRGFRLEAWTYGETARAARQLAGELQRHGVETGERVVLWGRNCAEWVVAFFACVLRGAVAVPMDVAASPDLVARVAREVRAKMLIKGQAQPELAGLTSMDLEGMRGQLASFAESVARRPARGRSEIVEIIFTSGATAEPKGVVLSHGNLLSNIEIFEQEAARYRGRQRFLRSVRVLELVPLSHAFGQMLGIFLPQLLGGTVLFHDSVAPSEVLRVLRTQDVSLLVAVPRMLDSLRAKIERDAARQGQSLPERLSRAAGARWWQRWIRFRDVRRSLGRRLLAVISGGATLDPTTERFWRGLGYLVIQGYGLTETAALISVNHPFKLQHGSIGKSLPSCEVKLDDQGEIVVRGQNVAAGYWTEQGLQPLTDQAGWFHTGDLGALDGEGHLYFTGRKKNVIVTAAGMKIYPEDLERALRAQPGVTDCAVVGRTSHQNEEPLAVLILRPGADATAVMAAANQALADFQQVHRWVLWPEPDFPRTPTHKIKRVEVKNMVERELAGGGKTEAEEAGALARVVATVSGRKTEKLSPDTRLVDDLGLGSLARTELLSALEDQYQVQLDEQRFAEAGTIGDVESLVRAPASEIAPEQHARWPQRPILAGLRALVHSSLICPLLSLWLRPKVVDYDRLRSLTSPVLIVCNHVTWVDSLFVLWALPAHLRSRLAVAMEGERLQRMRCPSRDIGLLDRVGLRLGYWLLEALFNTFGLPKSVGLRGSFTFAGELVDRGHSILVFPEGQRTPDGDVHTFRDGIGVMVQGLNIPVVPIGLRGLWHWKTRRLMARRTISIHVGEPERFAPDAEAREIARQLEARVKQLAATR